jgi:hypothetical protein
MVLRNHELEKPVAALHEKPANARADAEPERRLVPLEYNVDGFYETAPHALTLPRSTLMCMQLSVPIQPFVITQMPAPVPDPSIAYKPNRRRCILSAP